MIICQQCGVELDEEIQVCPLCGTSVVDGGKVDEKFIHRSSMGEVATPRLLKNVLWQIFCVLLVSCIVATLIIDFSRAGFASWSVYPATVCLILLCYSSLLAWWRARLIAKILTAWVVASALLVGMELYMGNNWPIRLALPILCAVNVVGILLIAILRVLKVQGLNILAIMFVAIAVLCLLVEGIVSLYLRHQIMLNWSVIVAACLLPVTAAVVFIHFRTRNNKELQKIFHT